MEAELSLAGFRLDGMQWGMHVVVRKLSWPIYRNHACNDLGSGILYGTRLVRYKRRHPINPEIGGVTPAQPECEYHHSARTGKHSYYAQARMRDE